MEINRPKVGVSIILKNKDNQILVGKRKGSHGAGSWAFPGGHLEFSETGVKRESVLLWEEIGFTNDIFEKEGKHYITIFIELLIKDNTKIYNMEPEKCEEWVWKKVEDLEEPLFVPVKNYLKKFN
jgi:8-oxo-dGTP diphosphatase